VSRLAFLSPHEADVPTVSPLCHVQSAAFTDVSSLGKLEVRGEVEGIPIGPGRTLVVVDGDPRAERDRLRDAGHRVYDMTGALAALEVEGAPLMRRLTELDLDALPAVGSVARGTTAVIERLDAERFRIHVPVELSAYVADVLADLEQGLER